MAKKYRKKPVEVEAIQLQPDNMAFVVSQFVGIAGNTDLQNGRPVLIIHTKEGDMIANMGDWIIRGVIGEFYPCAPDVFQQTYEEVEPSDKEPATLPDNIAEDVSYVQEGS